jgi:uncharacterized protein (DUF362 family)
MSQDDVLTLTGENEIIRPGAVSRRGFMQTAAVGAAGLALVRSSSGQDRAAESKPPTQPSAPVKTNIDEIKAFPRTPASMPGRYPGRVVKVSAPGASTAGKIDAAKAAAAVRRGLAELTGESDMGKAFRQFVSPADVVGIKINPIGRGLLSTKPEVVDAVVDGLLAAGLPKANIVIWDRRHFQMIEAGYTPERFPGLEIVGTEHKGPNGEFYDDKGELWAKDAIDREAPFYFADLEMKYNQATLPMMLNEGKESYFSKIVTRRLTKIINLPILKNAGTTVTLCLKNLSYGSLSNTSRLHKIWAESVAQPCGFPVLRDKVVLNIVDGLQGCFDGGPGANPKFFYDPNLILVGTDPVAVDAIGHELMTKERIDRGLQQFEDKARRQFLDIAASLGLGVAKREDIILKELALA